MTRQMKTSGVEWIGDIPEKWNVFRIKNVAFLKGRIGWQGLKSDEYQEDGPFLVTGKDFKNGKIDWMSCVHITEERFDEAPEIHIRENDLLITKDGTVGKVAIAKNCPLKVSLNSGVLLIRSKNNSFFDQKFLYYVLCSNIFWMWFLSTLNGNSTIIHLYQEDFSNFSFSLPPLSEQKEIADYLDAKCAKIDTFIAKQKTVIEKLKEYKQSVITEAVTKGLNPAAPMKTSGVEWIGDIPEKWNVFRIKNVAFLKGRIGWQGLKSDEYQEDGPFLVTGKDFKNGKIDWMSCVHITEERFDEAPEIHIRENDLLITKDGTVGKVAIAKNCPLKVSLNSGVLLIRSKNNSFFDQKFLYYVLCSNIFWMWFLSTLNGNSTIIHLYQEDFSNFSFSLPPLSEQKEIADYLDAKCAKIDAFIAKKQTVIEKMTEYKKSLIYECVTGKREIV